MIDISGQVIAYRYLVLETLAQGSFGTTYLAQDTYLPEQPKCVIKQLKPESSDPNFLQIARRLFEQEASVLGTLGSHPYIPKLLSYFEVDEDFFLVQEFIDGISIGEELSRGRKWSEVEVKIFLTECLEILKFVHGLGVIHRDIKPDNLIRRSADQSVFLLDFGAVKQISLNQTHVVETTIAVGTPGYMPDEQIRGRPHTSSDIYALGAIGIYGLTGIRPVDFERSEEDEILWQDQAVVSAGLAGILSKMVRRDYRKRYHSVEDVLIDLQKSTSQSVLELSEMETGIQAAQTDPGIAPKTLDPSSTVSPLNPPENSSQGSLASPGTPKTNVQPPPAPEKGTAPVYAVGSNGQKRKRTALKVILPSTVLVAAGVGGFLLFGRNELAQTAAQLTQLHEQQKYSDCIDVGESALSGINTLNRKLINPLSKCYWGQANQLAEQTKFGDAVQLIGKVPQQSTYHFRAQQKVDEWSDRLLQETRKTYDVEGNLKEAVASVDHIPETSVVKPQAERLVKQWQDQHNAQQKKIDTAKKALKEGRAEDAIATAKQIKTPTYWKKIADQVQKDAKAAIASRPAAPAWTPSPPAATAPTSSPAAPAWTPRPPAATAPRWRATPKAPAYQPPAPAPAPSPAEPAPQSTPPAYQLPQRTPPAYQLSPPSPQPAPPPPQSAPAPAASQKEVVNICPGPLCAE